MDSTRTAISLDIGSPPFCCCTRGLEKMGRFQPPDKAGTKFTIFQWFARVGCPSMGGATRACRCLGRLAAAAAECHVRQHEPPPLANEAVRRADSPRVPVASAQVAPAGGAW